MFWGWAQASPSTVTTRSTTGIPVARYLPSMLTEVTFMTMAPASAGRPPWGTSRPRHFSIRISSAPVPYTLGRGLTSMLAMPLVFWHKRSMHSGLFFSMPMMQRGMPVYWSTAWMPRTMESALVSISWVSLVIQTSHSEALISRVSTGLLGCSLTSVGNPAPPRPTRPQARTAARKLALSVTTGGWTDGSTVCLPSVSMTTESHSLPLARRNGSTAVTLPDTLEWMLADTKPPASPISVPTHTSSPFLTVAFAGAPMCWLI